MGNLDTLLGNITVHRGRQRGRLGCWLARVAAGATIF